MDISTPTAKKRIGSFDALRGLSAILIVISHTLSRRHIDFDGIYSLSEWLLIAIAYLPHVTVPGFVVISGFFLTREELKPNRPPAWRSFLKRSTNVLGPYLFWSTALYLVVTFGPRYFGDAIGAHRPETFWMFLKNLALGRVYGHFFLYVIFQLYILSYLGLGRRGNPHLLTFVIVLFLQIYYSSGTYPGHAAGPRHMIMCLGWILYFLFGRWLGANFEAVKEVAYKWRGLFTLAVVALGVAGMKEYLVIFEKHGGIRIGSSFFFASLFNIFFITWFLTLEPIRGRLQSLLTGLGRYSYAIYILHVPYIFYFGHKLAFVYGWGVNSFAVIATLSVVAITLSVWVRISARRVLPARLDRLILGR